MITDNQKKNKRILPVYAPVDVNDSLVDSELQSKGIGHTIGNFELVDQNGNVFTQKNTSGKIYVTDFFFVNCGSICPKMTSQLQRVQNHYKDNNKVLILSHTVLPEVDTVEALRAYADQYGAIDGKWYFLTGNKKVIYNLARKNYFVVKEANGAVGDGGSSDFIHTENLVLIDSKKRIRGYYDGTSTSDVDRLIQEMQYLLDEDE